MNETITAFVETKHLALVGVSARKSKFGNAIHKALKRRGYQVYPVHRSLAEVGGDKCYRSLAELPDAVESLIICTKAKHAIALVIEAKEKEIKRIWFQQGADFSEAIAAAEKHGIDYVKGKCILMYATPVTGIHAVHRFFVKLFGKL